MQNRQFHCLNRMVSEVGIGTWQLGGTDWGEMSKQLALETLAAAAEQGVSLIKLFSTHGAFGLPAAKTGCQESIGKWDRSLRSKWKHRGQF